MGKNKYVTKLGITSIVLIFLGYGLYKCLESTGFLTTRAKVHAFLAERHECLSDGLRLIEERAAPLERGGYGGYILSCSEQKAIELIECFDLVEWTPTKNEFQSPRFALFVTSYPKVIDLFDHNINKVWVSTLETIDDRLDRLEEDDKLLDQDIFQVLLVTKRDSKDALLYFRWEGKEGGFQ